LARDRGDSERWNPEFDGFFAFSQQQSGSRRNPDTLRNRRFSTSPVKFHASIQEHGSRFGFDDRKSKLSRQITSVGVLDTRVSQSTCSWAPSSAHLQPRGESTTQATEKTLMRRRLARRTTTETAKDQKTSSRALVGEER
jgi:hypothetical protein